MAYFNGKKVMLNANFSIGGGDVDLSGVITCLNDIKALLEKGVFTEDVTSLMTQFAEDIEALEPIPSDYDVSFAEGVLTINKAPAEKDGSVLTIL